MFATVTMKTPVAETPDVPGQARGFRSGDGDAVRLASMTAEEQKVCPVTGAKLGSMGEPVPVEIEGKKIWTCCAACPPKLKADPAKYLARLQSAPPPKDSVLSVPESAVIDTGGIRSSTSRPSPASIEGRRVVLGPRSGDRFPVLDGLNPGEKVVGDRRPSWSMPRAVSIRPREAGLQMAKVLRAARPSRSLRPLLPDTSTSGRAASHD